MIKLIVSDLDGTLLTSKKQLPEEIFPLVEALNARGIVFAPASGRQKANLELLFAPVKDKIALIAENGALASYRGELLHCMPLPDTDVAKALAVLRAQTDLTPILCGERTAFYESEREPFHKLATNAYTSSERVARLEDAIGREPILKISVHDERGAAENGMKRLPALLPAFRTMISGFDWLDISLKGVNKGAALRALKKRLGVNKEEIVAFGDHMNDWELLEEAGHPFVPANAYPALKEKYPAIASNDEGGVIETIKTLLGEML